MKKFYFLLVCVVLPVVMCQSSHGGGFIHSRAAYYGTPDGKGTTSGACGYGKFGRNMNDAKVAAVSKLWRNGTGCGACYQVICTIPQYCNTKGVIISVSDYGEGDRTDFIMNKLAFNKLARPGAEKKVISYGVVDIVYKRVPCQFPNSNILLKVHENSRFRDYLSLVLLNVGGANDILALQIKNDWGEWIKMRRAYGAVFDLPNPPKGALTVKFLVDKAGWKQATDIIPYKWKSGDIYDLAFQL
ncbi:PREDICTED: expansin-like B1 [Tarenaya hassleriana]|uniref:expansin-like B1 n=1 Tax=Tarenaya hassleriana TaxID=28532 RepID=UPI00053C6204|nr:PREDICTED: expansin-like B1 [Tarenaya hassleriana]